MGDLAEIVAAFDELHAANSPAAIATVVAVEGSSYRKPGARMLVAADGRTWGGVSGGCLERDVARRARVAIVQGRCSLCRYETGGNGDGLDDDTPHHGEPGASLGCGGAIEVLIQPACSSTPGPLWALRRTIRDRVAVEMLTVFRVGGSVTEVSAGDNFFPYRTLTGHSAIDSALTADLHSATVLGRPWAVRRHLLPGGWIDVLVEQLCPPQPVIVFGEGSDVAPVVAAASNVGWHATVVGVRSPDALRHLAPAAAAVVSCPRNNPAAGVIVPPRAAAIVMTHDFRRDADVLRGARRLRHPGTSACLGRFIARYGCLRPPSCLRTRRRRGSAPIGLDIGAQTPEAIAIAIVAEVQAFLAGRPGGSLTHRRCLDADDAPLNLELCK